MPIIDREEFLNSLDFDTMPMERFCLVLSLCALINLQVLNRPADELLRETLRARQTFDYIENPTLDSVHISFFLFACFFGLNTHNTAWFYLREAVTFAQLIGLDNEESYRAIISRQDAAYRRRSFWIIFVSERAYSLQRHHTLSMQPSIDLPSSIDQDLSQNLKGFNYMVDLWSQINSDFLSMWNDKRFPVTPEWMAQQHEKLRHALPERLEISEVQEADILISQQWLRTILWQLSTSRMLLSSSASNEALRFSFPIQISQDLLKITNRMSAETLEVHGIGICEKVFEVASTLVDVMICDPALQSQEVKQKASTNLFELLTLLNTLRDGTSPWYALIREKIRSSLPFFDLPPLPEKKMTLNTSTSPHSASMSSLSPELPSAVSLGYLGVSQREFGQGAWPKEITRQQYLPSPRALPM